MLLKKTFKEIIKMGSVLNDVVFFVFERVCFVGELDGRTLGEDSCWQQCGVGNRQKTIGKYSCPIGNRQLTVCSKVAPYTCIKFNDTTPN
jgi:hypothetical protein